jgi:hypothetical protein
MTSSDPTPEITDPHLADAIARAERGRAMLERLAVMGMEIAEEVREQHRTVHLHPAPKHDLRRGYDRVARAVQLSLALLRVFEADLVAMRKGEAIKVRPPREARPSAPSPAPSPAPSSQLPALGPEGVRVRDAVRSAIDARYGRWDGAMDALDSLNERLNEYDRLERFLDLPFRDCVEAICRDLGLKPDWSTWSDETGFAGPIGKPDVKWHMIWRHDPKRAEARRQRSADVSSASLGRQVADGTSALREEADARRQQ